MTKIQFIFQNRQVLTQKKHFVLLLMQLQVSDLFVFNSYSIILLLDLRKMRNGVLFPMDPYVQPLQFQSKCWESADEQDTFWFQHRFRHADFYDVLRAFNLVDITLPDPFHQMRVGRWGHYSYYPVLHDISSTHGVSFPLR